MNATNPLATAQSQQAPPQAVLWALLTHSGEYYQIGLGMPANGIPVQMLGGNAPDQLKIVKLIEFANGDVLVYAFPIPGSELDKMKTGIEYRVPGMTVRGRCNLARFDTLKALMDEAEELAMLEKEMRLAELEDDDDDPEPEPEPEKRPNGAQQVAPAPQAPLPPPPAAPPQAPPAPAAPPFPVPGAS